MNVYEYLLKRFPNHQNWVDSSDEAALKSMPLKSGCGNDCRLAVDAAFKFANKVRMAYGDDRPEMIVKIFGTTVRVCRIFITG